MNGASQVLVLFLSSLSFLTRVVAVVLSPDPGNRMQSCECIGWQDAFTRYGANCSEKVAGEDSKVCAQVIKRLPNELFCVNENYASYPGEFKLAAMREPRQWCFVWPGCTGDVEAKWGAKYKWCNNNDAKLGDLDPLTLKDLADASEIPVPLIVTWAYPQGLLPLSKPLLEAFGIQPPPGAPTWQFKAEEFGPDVMEALKQYMSSGTPTIFAQPNMQPPLGIMKGNEFYWLNFRPSMSEEEFGRLTEGVLLDATPLKCVAGCDEAKMEAPWWSFLNDLQNQASVTSDLIDATVFHRPSSGKVDSCDCIGWQEAFKKGADCSEDGLEFCEFFMRKLPNEPMCINEWSPNWQHIPNLLEPRQWCFVGPDCETNLMKFGAKHKWCSEKDAKLSDVDPSLIGVFGLAHQIRVSWAMFWAYPTMEPEIQLTRSLLEVFGVQPPAGAPEWMFEADEISPSAMAKLKQMMDKGTTVTFLSKTRTPPFAIMQGKKLFYINFSDDEIEKFKAGLEFEDTPLRCIAGCNKAEPLYSDIAWWSSVNDLYLSGGLRELSSPMPNATSHAGRR